MYLSKISFTSFIHSFYGEKSRVLKMLKQGNVLYFLVPRVLVYNIKNATSKARKKTNIFLTKANQLQLLSEQKQREKQTAKSQKQVHASILAGAY